MSRTFVMALIFIAIGVPAQEPGLTRRVAPAEASSAPAAMSAPMTLAAPRLPNGNGTYQALRQRRVNGEAFTVRDLTFHRDAAVFTLGSGTVYLYGEAAGRVTGAVFLGQGTLHIEPPSAMERRQLKAVMKTEILDQSFSSAVFSFTDGTASELKKGSQGISAGSGAAEGRAEDDRNIFRKELHYDLEARLLEDVMVSQEGGFFLAELKDSRSSRRLIFEVDPHGAIGAAPEEIALLTSSAFGYDTTLGFRGEAARKAKLEGTTAAFRLPQQTLDLTVEKNGKLTGIAVTKVMAKTNGVRVVPLLLFPSLRVRGVWGPSGEALDFVQEDKERDSSFAVILDKPLASGETVQITTSYSGKDALSDEGNNNYFLMARESWYPNMRGELGNYAFYTMTFHTQKSLEVVATGSRMSDKEIGKDRVSVWQTLAPIAVAGFNLGEFKKDQSERSRDLQVVSYANKDLASRYEGFRNVPGMAVGTMSTTGMLQRATAEGDAAVQVYTNYFGPLPYDHVSLTQQTACNYGQSWPTLVYLPICYFWDTTIQHQLGVLDGDPSYWRVVTAHEVAHQWWGQTVGFESYRDQWMSEGFANESAALYLKATRVNDKEYREFWTLLRKRLLEKNAEGMRPVDVGPVIMGTRLNSSKTGGNVYQTLVYDKGAYILHSLERLYWTQQSGDQQFKAAMHDFVQSHRNAPATTEDFKTVMERHMPAWMDLDGNHKLDWFFDAYVFGTATPKYTIDSAIKNEGEETTVHLKVRQAEVPADFKMLVPVYMELENKQVLLLGRIPMLGPSLFEKDIKLGKLSSPAKQMLVNYQFDLLSMP